jgi:hypothetical protein
MRRMLRLNSLWDIDCSIVAASSAWLIAPMSVHLHS